MLPSPEPGGGPPRRILLLNHRREPVDPLRAALAGRGWTVRSAADLEASAAALREESPEAVLILPLTLDPESLEWEILAPLLQARGPALLLLPWRGAAASAADPLLRELGLPADWTADPTDLREIQARLRALLRRRREAAELRDRLRSLEGQLLSDHKTGLFNDRFFRRRLEEEFERSRRHGEPLSLLLLDLDDFKAVNDRSSYEFGDRVLGELAAVLRRGLRSIDIAARLGGDEFGVLLPNTRLDRAVLVARRLGRLARRTRLEAPAEAELDEVALRCSIGVACFEGQGLAEARALFLLANEELKKAKRAGKDRISFHDPRYAPPAGGEEAARGGEPGARAGDP